MRRGEASRIDLEPAIGGEIGATRPCIIVSNDAANRHSNRIQVVPITGNVGQVHLWEVPRKALADQIRTVAKGRVTTRLGALTPDELRRIEQALRFQLGLS